MDWMCLGAIKWYAQLLLVLFVIVCVVLMILVLLQKGRGGGLTAALGGAGGQTAFGSKTGDVFTWMTIVIAGLFLVLALLLTTQYKPYSQTPSAPVIAAPEGTAPVSPVGGEPAGAPALPEEQPTDTTVPVEPVKSDPAASSEAPATETPAPTTVPVEMPPQPEQK